MKIECPICQAELIHRKIDDGFVCRSISKDGQTKIISQRNNGSDEIMCSKNAEHEISDDMNEKAMNVIWLAEQEESQSVQDWVEDDN